MSVCGKRTVRRFIVATSLLFAGYVSGGSTLSGSPSDKMPIEQLRLRFAQEQSSSPDCSAEAAAVAIAEVDYENARDDLYDAYDAYHQCLYGGSGSSQEIHISAEHSVLKR